jgi:hypothetical protein
MDVVGFLIVVLLAVAAIAEDRTVTVIFALGAVGIALLSALGVLA